MKYDVVVFDGDNLIHRAFFAAGRTPNAYTLVRNWVDATLLALQPKHAFVARDDVGASWRKEVYPAYKAGRSEKDAVLSGLLVRSRTAPELFFGRTRLLSAQGYEADDVIASVVWEASCRVLTTAIVTGDNDLLALVSDGSTVVLGPGSAPSYLSEAAVKQKCGVPPWKLEQYKALAGCTSDNIPGVPGIGPKRAVALLERHGSFHQVLLNLTTPPVKGSVESAKVLGNTSYLLTRLVRDVPFSAPPFLETTVPPVSTIAS